MALPHLRTAAVSPPYQATYTLGGTERFRLDAVSFSVAASPIGDYVIPVVQAATPDGLVIGQIAAPQAVVPFPQAQNPMQDTSPVAVTDSQLLEMPGAVVSFGLHDYTGFGLDSTATFTWPQPPGLRAQRLYTWLVNSGAAVMGSNIGSGVAQNAASVTTTLFGGASAGDYLLLHLSYLAPNAVNLINNENLPVVTDSSGAGVLTYGPGFFQFGNGVGVTVSSALQAVANWGLYRLTANIAAGATVTLSFPGRFPTWMELDIAPITGLRRPNPFGVTPPNDAFFITGNGTTSPVTTTGFDGIWNSAVIANGIYLIASGGELDVQYGRGLYDTPGSVGQLDPTTPLYSQVKLPEWHLAPQDTITMFTTDDTFQVRTGDVISRPVLWAIDDAA